MKETQLIFPFQGYTRHNTCLFLFAFKFAQCHEMEEIVQSKHLLSTRHSIGNTEK